MAFASCRRSQEPGVPGRLYLDFVSEAHAPRLQVHEPERKEQLRLRRVLHGLRSSEGHSRWTRCHARNAARVRAGLGRARAHYRDLRARSAPRPARERHARRAVVSRSATRSRSNEGVQRAQRRRAPRRHLAGALWAITERSEIADPELPDGSHGAARGALRGQAGRPDRAQVQKLRLRRCSCCATTTRRELARDVRRAAASGAAEARSPSSSS